MNLSKAGIMEERLWQETLNQFRYTELGEFIVMPNFIQATEILFSSE